MQVDLSTLDPKKKYHHKSAQVQLKNVDVAIPEIN
jgi:hypothetical protein